MGEIKGYTKYKRQDVVHRPVGQRIRDYRELDLPFTPDEIRRQAARCMDCGIPFCHGAGCPLGNSIPDFNDLVYKGQWERACRMLHATNNFPEITGRICPAPCETACTLAINDEPVTIRQIEQAIVERGFEQGWIKPVKSEKKTGKRVAIIGSGPAGLAAAQQLARAGHDVVVYERDEHPGGMLRYGIPDFKLEKQVLDRRIEQLTAEGVQFQTGLDVGTDISTHYLQKMFDCICLTMGARQPRDIAVPGREYGNIIFALDYLTTQNRLNNSEPPRLSATAKDRVVAVIGGGDTGSDCLGTARRQGAKKIYQLEILPKPPESRPIDTPWPMWPRIMRTSTSHEEGCERTWSVMTKKFLGSEKNVSELHGCKVEWIKPALPVPSKVEGSKVEEKDSEWKIQEVPGTDFVLKVDLVLLAMGFLHVVHKGFIQNLGLQLDDRGNVLVTNPSTQPRTGYQTSKPWVFAAGDAISGASLVVNAIKSGREAAAAIHRWLIHNT